MTLWATCSMSGYASCGGGMPICGGGPPGGMPICGCGPPGGGICIVSCWVAQPPSRAAPRRATAASARPVFRGSNMERSFPVMCSSFYLLGLTSAQRPTEHQQTTDSNPAAGDAHGDACPVRPQLHHERGGKHAQHTHCSSQSKDRDDRDSRLAHARAVHVAVY